MKRLLTERDRAEIRKALWERYCKYVNAPRKARLLYLEQLYNDWYAAFRRQEAYEAAQPVLESATDVFRTVRSVQLLAGRGDEAEGASQAPGGNV